VLKEVFFLPSKPLRIWIYVIFSPAPFTFCLTADVQNITEDR